MWLSATIVGTSHASHTIAERVVTDYQAHQMSEFHMGTTERKNRTFYYPGTICKVLAKLQLL